MNILYIADLNSIHDINWIKYSADNGNKCFAIQRESHEESYNKSQTKLDFVASLGGIPDYSTIRFWLNGFTLKKLEELIKKHHIDLVHIMYAEPNMLWSHVNLYAKLPIILTTRGTDVLKTIPLAFNRRSVLNFFVKKNYKKAYQQLSVITCTSESQKNNIQKLFGLKVPIEIVKTGVNVELMESRVEPTNPTNPTNPFILFPRKMKPIYNHEFSLKALKRLPDSIKNQYEMVFIDNDGDDQIYIAKIKVLMEEQPDVKFKFLPSQDQNSLFELYNKSSLVIMNPHSDGSPVSAMEAMYFEKPLILGPIPYDKLFDGVPKLTKWDQDELANLVVKELSTPTNYNGKQLISTMANSSIEMSKLNSLYKSMVV